jgi:hypothetical protein
MNDLQQPGVLETRPVHSPISSRARQVLLSLAVHGLQAALVAGVVIASLGGRDRAYRIPFDFSGDALTYLAQSKSTVDNGWWWVNPREGAPLGLQALLFPSNSNVDQAIVWSVSLIFRDPLLSTNLAWIAMLVVAGWIATFGFRTLGCSRLSAFVAGTLFALSPYALYRNLGHFGLVTYLVPFPATVAMLLLSARAPAFRQWPTTVPLLAGCALLGFNYVYYAFFGCFFIALGTVAGFWRARDPQVLRFGSAAVGTIAVCVALNFAPSLVVAAREGSPIVVRQKVPAEAEVYALKIRQLVSPLFQHSFPPFRAWTDKEAAAKFPVDTENVVSRLGLVASLGFIALLGVLFVSRNASAVGSHLVSASHLTIAGLLLATMGGFGSLFNLLVVPDIRAYNRICPFLAFFALVAIAAGIDSLSRRGRRWGQVVAVSALILGVWDQAHALRQLEAPRESVRTEYAGLLSLVTRLEMAVPAQSMVLQLPFTIYLNDDGRYRMRPYDHFKPYLASRTLRWSYPAMSNTQLVWQEAASQLQPAELASLAASQGFRAILIDRFGYADNAAAVMKELLSTPGVRLLVEDERYAAVEMGGLAPLTTAFGQPIHEFLRDEPITPTLAACPATARVGFERIGKTVLPAPPGPVEVPLARDLAVAGWVVTPETNEAGYDVELAIDNDVYATFYGFERPDVVAYLRTPASGPSEFRVVIPAARLRAGSHTLAVRVLQRSQPCFFEGPPMQVNVR